MPAPSPDLAITLESERLALRQLLLGDLTFQWGKGVFYRL